jgi:hypothetical protein
MNKIFLIFIITLLTLSGISTVAVTNLKKIPDVLIDELDQYQEVMTENAVAIVGQVPIPENITNIQVAQSFIPTKEIITRAELYIARNSTTTYPINVSIRAELTEEDLTKISIDPALVSSEELGWVEIDFADILITTVETYYLVALTKNTTDNFYAWGANNVSESYPFGCAWFSYNDGKNWTNESTVSNKHIIESSISKYELIEMVENGTWDMCFKTYGRTNNPPEKPSIDGPKSGKIGIEYNFTLNASDHDGDHVRFHIDWNDTNTEITDYYPSGTDLVVNHIWTEIGLYIITVQAEDSHGFLSEKNTFEVSIPRGKARFYPIIIRLFHLLQNNFQIIQQYLGY